MGKYVRRELAIAMTFMMTAVISMAAVSVSSIPDDQLDTTKIYCGNPAGFSNPAEVEFEDIVRSTNEFKEIKKKKLDQGTAEYWILIEQANHRAMRAVHAFHQESAYDFVTARGYLGAIDPPISAPDVTEEIRAIVSDV